MNALYALLVLFLLRHTSSSQYIYSLSPQLPPSAFLGMPYACQFQVSGLSSPNFTFQGLPKQMIGDSSGLLKGTPANKGTLSIVVTFSSNNYKASQQILLRVMEKADYPINANLSTAIYPTFSISVDIDTFVFMAGTFVNLRFKAVMGTPPYQWSYLRLPIELNGTKEGTISGYFSDEGYYSFGVVVGDKNGESTDLFITLNIQPLTFFTQWAPQALRSIVDIPVRDYFNLSTSKIVQNNYLFATQQANEAKNNVSDLQKLLREAQRNVSKMNYAVYLSKQYLQAAEQQLAKATSSQKEAEEAVNKTSYALGEANKTVGSKVTALKMAEYNHQNSRKKVAAVESICSKLTYLLNKASKELTEAQNDLLTAELQLEQAERSYNDSEDALALTLTTKDMALQQLQTKTASAQHFSGQVDIARAEVTVAKEAVALAQDSYNTANQTAMMAAVNLTEANNEAALLNRAAGEAKSELGQAEMKLTLALNTLYVAAAAKEQADKAMAIISAQVASTDTSKTSFAGCSQGAYPTYFGSGEVAKTLQDGFLLSSGQLMLIGDCTLGTLLTVGDIVSFEGYLRDGSIHLLSFTKVMQN